MLVCILGVLIMYLMQYLYSTPIVLITAFPSYLEANITAGIGNSSGKYGVFSFYLVTHGSYIIVLSIHEYFFFLSLPSEGLAISRCFH